MNDFDVYRVIVSRAAKWSFTPREAEVFEALVKGLSNKELASLFDISVHTTEIHISNMMKKSGCTSRAKLIAAAYTGETR